MWSVRLTLPRPHGDQVVLDAARLDLGDVQLQLHGTGLVLVDTGLPTTPATFGGTLHDLGATWGDVTDVVVSHGHSDHVGGLAEVIQLAPHAAVWGSARKRQRQPDQGLATNDLAPGQHA
jgi:glyoxylase-like metal-dependent hydrolase (beta-lactamase superfamily II)